MQENFDAFYETLFPRLSAELYAYLGDRGDAEDVVQEAMLKAWTRWDQVCGYDEPSGWVRRVAWNLAVSRWRRLTTATKAMMKLHPSTSTEALGPDHVALVAALRKLPDRHRRAIVLHYIADLPVAQIAADLSTPLGTVQS